MPDNGLRFSTTAIHTIAYDTPRLRVFDVRLNTVAGMQLNLPPGSEPKLARNSFKVKRTTT